MKKSLIIIIALILILAVAAAVLFLFVLNDKELPYVRTEFSPGDFFVTNIKESPHLLKVAVVLVLDTDTLQDTLSEQSLLIRDTITMFLRDQSLEALQATDLSGMKTELVNALNERLEFEHIIDILFSDMVIQLRG